MISKLILDSSVLVEYAKKNKMELLDHLLKRIDIQLFINSTVLSEYAFHWLASQGKKAPRTLQQNRQIGPILSHADLATPLSQFTVLPSDDRIVPIYLNLMERYNLLPNDALILASAKLHNIPAVASYDPDFKPACAGEGIRLVQTVADLA